MNVTRQPMHEPSSIADLENIEIEGHEEFKFEPNELKYSIVLNKGETKLGINLVKKDESTECVPEGNEELKSGSKITIDCVSENEEHQRQYTIKVTGVDKKFNTFLIIIIVYSLYIEKKHD